jgi:uncharacterized protein
MKLDIFNHVFPKKFYERMLKVAPNGKDMHKRVREIPCIVDLGERFRIMDAFGEDYAQVICLPSPPIEVFGPPPLSTAWPSWWRSTPSAFPPSSRRCR